MDKEELVQSIIENLAKCQRPALNAGWKRLGLSHAQTGMLYLLFYHQPATVKQISEHMGITKSAVSQLVDPLADKGLIRRQNDPRDRRVVRLRLSGQGSQLLRRLAKHKFAGLRLALDGLSRAELETLHSLHLKMALGIEREEAAND